MAAETARIQGEKFQRELRAKTGAGAQKLQESQAHIKSSNVVPPRGSKHVLDAEPPVQPAVYERPKSTQSRQPATPTVRTHKKAEAPPVGKFDSRVNMNTVSLSQAAEMQKQRDNAHQQQAHKKQPPPLPAQVVERKKAQEAKAQEEAAAGQPTKKHGNSEPGKLNTKEGLQVALEERRKKVDGPTSPPKRR